MGSSNGDLRIVKLTKFKKMSSTPDLDKFDEEDTVNFAVDETDRATGSCSNSSSDSVALQESRLSQVPQKPDSNAKSSKRSQRIRKKSIFLLPADDASKFGGEFNNQLQNTECHYVSSQKTECQQIPLFSHSIECQNNGNKSRRKSWCVETSIKKQFQRNSEGRRTLERSECLPPLLESPSVEATSVSSPPARFVGLIDQRLRRLKLTGKAMTLSIPSERRSRPSIFDSSRRRCSEAGLSLTLAGLKARRKSEVLAFFGASGGGPDGGSKFSMTDNLKQSLKNPLCNLKFNSKESAIIKVNKPINSFNNLIKDPTSDSFKDLTPHALQRTCSDTLIQEILSFNGRNIFDPLEHFPPQQEALLEQPLTKREADKGSSLLLQEEGEESLPLSEGLEEAQDLAKNLRRHLSSFADRLHLTKDRLEDTAKCYLLLDKAYEWALEAMKAVGRVKTSGTATPEQVGAAVEAIGGLLQENPPVPEETFTAMLDMASRLNNQTLLQQCKMAHARCEETMALLRSRQASLLKARRQMEFDCQSFVDLNEVLGSPLEEPPTLTWLSGTPLNNSGRRRSGCSVGSRPRDPLSRCSSFDTDDDSVFSESPFSSTPSKTPVEAKSSLGGIKELRESAEDLRGTRNFVISPHNYMRSSAIDFRMAVSTIDPPIVLGRNSPMTLHPPVTASTARAFSSGSSSCSSSDSSGPVNGNTLFKDHSRSSWRFSDTSHRSAEEANDSLDESSHPLSPLSNRCSLPSAANSHLLIRGSQINLSNSEDLSNEEVRRNKTLLLIMQELIQTERDYVNSLEYIIENYGPELLRDDIPQALRGQRNVIFGNFEKIFEFHSGYFLRSLENCQSRPFAVGSIFLKYESQFYLYALYNKNKPKSDDLMSEFGSTFFKAKQMELGDKMDLSSYLLKPVQRMGKYALLLKQLLKECDRNEEGFEDLKAAEEMVQFQLRHGNDLLAMDSLRDCDVNLKEQGRLLRQGEFLVSEGNKGKKSLRHVFLFEDLILFSKTKRDPEKKTLDVFQYKQSLKSSDIGLTEQVGDNPVKFEIWFRKRKPSDTFVLQASSLAMKEAWTEEISKLLWRQALKNRKLRLHEMSSMGIGNKPCLDIRPSEDQINDRSVCMGKAPPRLRLSSSTGGISENSSGVRRPHSVISVSSSGSSTGSSGSSHSSSAGPSYVGTLNLGFESGDSPKPLQRSVTRTSQCSAESGILADLFPDRDLDESHSKVERSNSTATNTSVDSVLSPSSPLSLSVTPTSVPSSPSTLTLPEGSTHPLSRQHRPLDGTNKTLLMTEV